GDDGSAEVIDADIAVRVLDCAQSEQDRRERLSRLVVQLPCEPTSLDLLAGDDAAERVARDTLRQVDGDRRAHRELLGQTEIGAGETVIASNLVVRDQDADRTVAG